METATAAAAVATASSPPPLALPPLDSLPAGIHRMNVKQKQFDAFRTTYAGPTETSNWLIPGRVLMSAYPGALTAPEQTGKLRAFLGASLDTFVSLQQPEELSRFNPYKHELELINHQLPVPLKLSFLSLPIPDNYITDDDSINSFSDELTALFHAGRRILIHCWGGHGRTGTLAAILLGKLYNLKPDEALLRVGLYHKCRAASRSEAPQTRIQMNQVKRILSQHLKLGYTSDEEVEVRG